MGQGLLRGRPCPPEVDALLRAFRDTSPTGVSRSILLLAVIPLDSQVEMPS